MPGKVYELADPGEYLPNDGIYITDILTVPLVGNNRPPGQGENPAPKGNNPPGTYGKMNTGVGEWMGNPYTLGEQLNPGKPSRYEIYGDEVLDGTTGKPFGGGMAEYFGVQPRTVERWFSMKTVYGVQAPRNCVYVKAVGQRFYALPEILPVKNVSGISFQPEGAGVKQRAIMATGLCVKGGLQATPHFTKGGDPEGTPKNRRTFAIPFRQREYRENITDCVRLMFTIAVGMRDDITDPPTSAAWVQMTIEPARDNDAGWELVILYFMPANAGEYKERASWDLTAAGMDDSGEGREPDEQ